MTADGSADHTGVQSGQTFFQPVLFWAGLNLYKEQQPLSEKFPEIKFVSKSFDGEQLIGDLTIRDVTKEVSLDVEFNGIAVDPYGQTKAGFEVKGEVNRKDFNLTWNAVTEAGSIVVSVKVKLEIDVQLIKQA